MSEAYKVMSGRYDPMEPKALISIDAIYNFNFSRTCWGLVGLDERVLKNFLEGK